MHNLLRYLFLTGLLFSFLFMSECSKKDPDAEAEFVRQIEQKRVRALVEEDMAVAQELHAEDFQLITPDGSEYTKQTYLNQIKTKKLDYRIWEPGEITVRLYKDAAIIRYDDSVFEVFLNGKLARRGILRHMNLYEKRNGRWQIVWSQASGGQSS